MKENKYNLSYVFSLAMVSALGGLLFGYDWVVIGGAKPFYEVYFDIAGQPSLQGWAMSSALIGCIFGALVAGALSDKYGRKNLLIVAAGLFVISAFGTGDTNDFIWFIIYRMIGGAGIGLASTLSPMYIAEISPSEFRGRFVSINQLTIVIGILAAQIVNILIAEPVPGNATPADITGSWNGQSGWRWMFWAELVPAVLFFIMMFMVPESPRFLVKLGDHRGAVKTLSKVGGKIYADNEINHIKASLSNNFDDKVSYKALFSPEIAPIVLIGVVLAVFQQWCGINVIFNYAQEVFQAADYNINDMYLNIIITGGINLIFTLVAMRLVDRVGRRTLMLFGSIGLALIYLILGSLYYFAFSGWPVLLIVVIAIAIYAMSLAPVTWVVLSEIFPNRVRGVAMSLATLSLWVASFILTFTFPLLNDLLGTHGSFWIYSIICLGGFLFMHKKLPETKNRSLEEIEKELTQNKINSELVNACEN
ncbi:MAG: sugar porter family MFS transporter [Cytophagales bacterium]|nr:sugar porter family MFS transporter [Cytophagales bacterium]